jgi:hypothetical protein
VKRSDSLNVLIFKPIDCKCLDSVNDKAISVPTIRSTGQILREACYRNELRLQAEKTNCGRFVDRNQFLEIPWLSRDISWLAVKYPGAGSSVEHQARLPRLESRREECRHSSLAESIAQVTPLLPKRLSHDVLLARSIDVSRSLVETGSLDGASREPSASPTSTKCPGPELDRIHSLCNVGTHLPGKASQIRRRFPGLISTGLNGNFCSRRCVGPRAHGAYSFFPLGRRSFLIRLN